MHALDLSIIVAYLLLMMLVGWWVAKRAALNSESYFLAGKRLPWWVIGVAHGSSGIDIGGTMWFVTMLFIYGVKGLFLLWIWPLFNVLFRMMYLGTWVRRSNVLTGAEWMRTRFGQGLGGELAYLSVVLYAMVSVIGFLSYAFKPLGKFAQPFFPMDWSANTYALILMLVTGIYGVFGGMYSVVLNDLIQFVLILAAAIIIAAIAIAQTRPDQIQALVPAGWDNLFFGWRLDLDWSSLMPSLQDVIYGPEGHGYSVFGFFILMLFLKGVLVSMAGPTPNYAIQHVLSTRSPREAALENLVMCVVSLAPRFLLIGGIAVLGIVFFSPELRQMGPEVDFEVILPKVVARHLPVGCKGLILAGLIAAFMSTFISTVNSGVAYIVNDIYRPYVRPAAPPRHYVRLGYACSAGIILIGIGMGYTTLNVHSVTKWVTAALVPAFVIPNVLKWHWWRFNGHGFWAGMAAGTASALAVPALAPGLKDVWLFLSILALSSVASCAVCWLTPPEPDAVLKRFYRTVRPWGFWKPVLEKCRAETPALEANRDCARDWFNIAVGLVWQISMVAFPIYLVLQQYRTMWIHAAVFAATSLILKFTWYDRLGPGDMVLEDTRPPPESR
ncbi:MAG: sodium:solute symporter [Verrucomicrobia bacterium]|nr:sodium:solute symporter [Verrucomicrobiota bacterium]